MNNYNFLELINTEIVKYKKDNKYYVSFNIFIGFCDIYGYSLFIPINEFISKDHEGNEIFTFINNIKMLDNAAEIAVYINDGIDDFYPGENYFVSESLGNFIGADESIVMPDYLISFYDHIECNLNAYEDLSNIYNKDIPNLNYFISKNYFEDNEFSIEDINKFYMTFFKLINKLSTLDDFTGINELYRIVINYWMNGQVDDTLVNLNILSNYTPDTTTTNTSGCGCSSSSSCYSSSIFNLGSTTTTTLATNITTDDSNSDCIVSYQNNMKALMIQMLSDPQFYCDWFNIDLGDDTQQLIPNEVLCDALINLIKALIGLEYDINTGSSNNSFSCGHMYKGGKCPNSELDNYSNYINDGSNNCGPYKILNNYIKVLEWVKNGEIKTNINKIKIYGKEFGELLPNLIFI